MGETRNEMRRIRAFSGDKPAPGLLAERLGLPEDEATSLWEEFISKEVVPKKPMGRPKKAKKKTTPVKHRPSTDQVQVKSQGKAQVKSKGMHSVPTIILRWISALVGIVVLIRSVMFNYSYFVRTDESWVAWLMAASISAILFVSAQILVEGWIKRNWAVILSSALVFLSFVFVNIYITSDVLSTSRENVIAKTEQGYEAIQKANRMIPILTSEVAKDEKQTTLLQTEREQLLAEQKALDKASPTYQKDYDSTRNRLLTNKTSIDALILQSKKDSDELKNYKATEGLDNVSFVSSTEKNDARTIDKVFAFGLDVVGPWLVVIALFLE